MGFIGNALEKVTSPLAGAGGALLKPVTGLAGGILSPVTGLLGGTLGNITNSIQQPIKGNFEAIPTNPNIVNFANSPQYQQANAGVNNQLGAQSNLESQLAAQQGIANQGQVFSDQQALARQLQAQASGQGPNPAAAALNQATGENIQNQSALMASQRGASRNPALLARQAAQQGGALQQNAVGQSAILQAQQQLGAQQALQNQQAAMGALANQQAAQQIANQQALSQNALANQQSLLQGIGQQNQTQAGIQNVQQQGLSGITQANADQAGKLLGGIAGGAGAALGLAQGGEVKNPKLGAVKSSDRYPSHEVMPPHLQKVAKLYYHKSFGGGSYQPQTKMAQGGGVRDQAGNVGGSGQTNSLDLGSVLKAGGKVPGRARVQGDSEKNDTVAAKLSPGEVVLPRTVMNSKDPVKAAADFVAALEKKKGKNDHQSEFKEALKKAMMGRKKQ